MFTFIREFPRNAFYAFVDLLIKIRASFWIILGIILLTAFVMFPSNAAMLMLVTNIVVLIGIHYASYYEGKYHGNADGAEWIVGFLATKNISFWLVIFSVIVASATTLPTSTFTFGALVTNIILTICMRYLARFEGKRRAEKGSDVGVAA